MKPRSSLLCSESDVAWLTLSDSHMTYWQEGLDEPIYLKLKTERAVCESLSWFLGQAGKVITKWSEALKKP